MHFLSIGLVWVLALGTFAARPQPAPVRDRATPVAVGDTAPDFTLQDTNGGTVTLSKSLAHGPTVLVFYRGYWCPFCAHQLSELRSLLQPGEKINLFAISVDDPATSKTFAAKIAADGKAAFTFPLLSDPGHATIDAYGLHDSAYDGGEFDGIPHAAVYVVDRTGKVAWARVSDDYKQRPSNADIRAALAALEGK